MANLFGGTGSSQGTSAFALQSVASTFGTATNKSGGGLGLFGATTNNPLGQQQQQQPSLFSFGQPTQPAAAGSTAFPTFGAPATTSAFTFGGFGTAGTQPSSLFGAGSAQQPASTGFGAGGLFGAAPKTTQSYTAGLFNFPSAAQQTAAPSQQPQVGGSAAIGVSVDNLANFIASLTQPLIYGDERDRLVANFNQLQAFCGCGRGYFNQSAAAFDYTPENPFCRLKSVCYNRLDTSKDEDGLIGFVFKKPESVVKANLQTILDELWRILGKKPEIAISVEATKPLPENKCELVVYITETTPIGAKRRILASEAYAFFSQQSIRQQLVNSLLIEHVLMKVVVSSSVDKMKDCLALPQGGLDVLLWNQAVAENPDPSRLIPHPILGFKELRERQMMQKIECDVHDSCLKELSKKLEQLDQRIILKQTKIMEFKSVEKQLSHKLLTILSKYFLQIRRGFSFEVNEENLKATLETAFAQLNGSAQLKTRLAEVSSQLKLKNGIGRIADATKSAKKFSEIDDDLIIEIKQYLRKCQDAVENLASTISKDQKDLNIMQKVMVATLK